MLSGRKPETKNLVNLAGMLSLRIGRSQGLHVEAVIG